VARVKSVEATLPEPGSDIQLRLEGDPQHRTLSSKVAQADDRRGAMVVRSPAWEGHSVTVPPGTRMAMLWSTPGGEHIMVAQLVAVAGETIPLWVVRAEGPPQKAQRRNFVRVEMLTRIPLIVNGVEVQATSLDLSEGGLRVSVKLSDRVTQGQPIYVILQIGETELQLEADVMRTWERTNPPRLDVGLKFTNLTPQQRDLIREHVFSLLRKQRRRSES
jgi:c-di-GMP-binding flagellar brake protein YcgR